jgi:hypothetical protein
VYKHFLIGFPTENACLNHHKRAIKNSLGFGDEFKSVIPVFEQFRSFFIPQTDIVILKHARKEIVNLSCDVQNAFNSAVEIKVEK